MNTDELPVKTLLKMRQSTKPMKSHFETETVCFILTPQMDFHKPTRMESTYQWHSLMFWCRWQLADN